MGIVWALKIIAAGLYETDLYNSKVEESKQHFIA